MEGRYFRMMNLFIETLTGSVLQLRVSPFETVQDVKARIQKQEGIAISQQHLIWQSMELDDDYTLQEYGISDDATLKLVLTMRVGPINSRRVPVEDPSLRDMAEYFSERSSDSFLPNGQQLTVIVYSYGDQHHFFRLVGQDASTSPLSDSSGTGLDDEDDSAVVKERQAENDKTRENMRKLQARMADISMSKSKKQRKKVVILPRPPSSNRPKSRARLRRLEAELASGQSVRVDASSPLKSSFLPAIGQSIGPQPAPRSASPSPAAMGANVTSTVDILRVESARASDLLSRRTFQRTIVKSDLPQADTFAPAVDDFPVDLEKKMEELSEETDDALHPLRSATQRLDSLAAVRKSSAGLRALSTTSDFTVPRTPQKTDIRSQRVASTSFYAPHPPMLPRLPVDSGARLSAATTRLSSDTAALLSTVRPTAGASISDKDSPNAPVRDSTFDSAVRRTTTRDRKSVAFQSLNASEVTGMLNSMVRSTSRTRDPTTSTVYNILGTGAIAATHEQPPRISTPRLLSGRLRPRSGAGSGFRLPLMKAEKKKTYQRCAACGKKTRLATGYMCRCGKNFCAIHRYAEAHGCTYDYKTEGRKILEQDNPIVTAPKLPKI